MNPKEKCGTRALAAIHNRQPSYLFINSAYVYSYGASRDVTTRPSHRACKLAVILDSGERR